MMGFVFDRTMYALQCKIAARLKINKIKAGVSRPRNNTSLIYWRFKAPEQFFAYSASHGPGTITSLIYWRFKAPEQFFAYSAFHGPGTITSLGHMVSHDPGTIPRLFKVPILHNGVILVSRTDRALIADVTVDYRTANGRITKLVLQ